MKLSLVEYLACPLCRGTLEYEFYKTCDDFEWREVLEGILICVACQKEYSIKAGVPRLIPDHLTKDVQATVEGFGYEWESFDGLIQDTYMTDTVNFLDFIYPIKEDFFKDKIVLDAGCGMGRFLQLAAEFGSHQVIGVDLSQSVEVTYRHIQALPNAHVIQADIMNLPFQINFDYIFSIGVLQFLENPDQGFAKLVELLKENGAVSFWVYSRENNNWAIRFVSPLRKYITSRLPHSVLFFLSHVLGFFLHLCLQLIYRPANESKIGQSLKLPKILPYNEYLYYTSRLTYESIASVIFDHLAPRLTTYISKEELQNWMDKNNLSQVKITSRNNMSWRGFGVLSK